MDKNQSVKNMTVHLLEQQFNVYEQIQSTNLFPLGEKSNYAKKSTSLSENKYYEKPIKRDQKDVFFEVDVEVENENLDHINMNHNFLNRMQGRDDIIPFVESTIPKNPALSDLLQNEKVKSFIDLSKKVVSGKVPLKDSEKEEIDNLFKDPMVKAYIAAAVQTGKRDGWIFGSLAGGILGLIGASKIVASAGLTAFLPVFAASLVGAIAGGVAIGFVSSKALAILREWEAEDDVVKLGAKTGGVVGRTMPVGIVEK